MEIRTVTGDDLDDLLPLMRAYCDFYESDPTDEGMLEMSREIIADRDSFQLIARDGDGAALGYAMVDWKWSNTRGARIAVMEDLFVRQESRGSGLADSLIAECADRARAAGAPCMTWLTQTDNDRAQAVYDRTGATSDGYLEYKLEL
jgi:ribosomal protein S18 acetylase RimI-like enzyme